MVFPHPAKLLQFAAVWVAVTLLVGCSLVQLAYNNLDWLIPWYVDDYITLRGPQERLLDELVRKELGWHRTTQLPQYAAWLEELSQDVASGFTDARLTQHLDRFEEFRKALMLETATHTAALLATVSQAQVVELFDNFETYNRRFYEKYIGESQEELQRRRIDRMEGIFADWLGPLTARQRAALEHWSRQRGSIAPEILAYRQRWQARLGELLLYRTDEPRFTRDMQLLFVNPHLYSPPTYLEKRERNIMLGKELFLAIMDEATPAQRARLRQKLEKYARDFIQLSLQT